MVCSHRLDVFLMVLSMTGFGRSRRECDHFAVTVELKTVNHRFSEFHFRMPRQLIKIEDKLKKKVSEYISRGRVEIYVTIEGEGSLNRKVSVDWKLLDDYYHSLQQIQDKYSLSQQISIQDLLNRDEFIYIDEIDSGNEDIENMVLNAAEEAVLQLRQMREKEGEALAEDVEKHLLEVKLKVDQLREYAPLVVTQFAERLQKRMVEFAEGQLDESRIVNEVAIFAEKADINEELTRLHSHIGQFQMTLQLNDTIGRKLDFLLQEMNREVNTIGSKANNSQIAKEVVEMKSLLEKMKEQVQNIE